MNSLIHTYNYFIKVCSELDLINTSSAVQLEIKYSTHIYLKFGYRYFRCKYSLDKAYFIIAHSESIQPTTGHFYRIGILGKASILLILSCCILSFIFSYILEFTVDIINICKESSKHNNILVKSF